MRRFAFWIEPFAIAAALAAAMMGLGLAQSEAPDTLYTLGEIEVVRHAIYREENAEAGLGRWINATHWTTRESVIRREIWRSPGETVDEAFAEELERNLRGLGLFAEVVVRLVPSGNPGAGSNVRDLHITTRDRLSIGIGAGGAFVGDVASGNASLSESNVFGLGDRLFGSFQRNDFGETRGDVSYFDRYVAGTWTSATAQAGRREEGNAFGLRFDRPFRYLEDKVAWSVSGSTASVDQDFFAGNDVVAEVPFDIERFAASVRWRSGSRMNFWTRGLSARYSNFNYFGARGVASGSLRVPGDTQLVFAGGTLAWTEISAFREVTNLDTLKFVQDVQLGTTASLEAGALYREEEIGGQFQTAAGGRVMPQFSVNLRRTMALGESRYASARLSTFGRFDDSDVPGWRTDVDLRAFDLSFQPHTIGLAVSYTEVKETQNLPIQLVLGESSGLRGYPNRELTGQRILQLNLEDRIDLDLNFLSFDFGAVVFGDAAWIGNRGGGLDGPFTSAGAGLRIGSTELLGRNVLRMDFSVPFDDVNGRSFDPLFSLTIGQVFSL